MCIRDSICAERIKDLASVAGVRKNQLVGYGLVVGLDGTGDQTNQAPFTSQSFASMLNQFGIAIPEGVRFNLKNVAAVALHADLPPFSKPGQNLDVTVSSVANAQSLRGGVLLMAPLKGADGQVYAVAQGNVIVGGYSVRGRDGFEITTSINSVGRIADGAIVEREVPTRFGDNGKIIFNLHTPDFTTAKRVAKSINTMVGPNIATPMDAVSISVQAPQNPAHRVDYLSLLENINVSPGESSAKIIVNARTGTVVVGQHVTVKPVAISHGTITVTIREDFEVSQPAPFSGGETVVVPNTEIEVTEESGPMFQFGPTANLNEIIRAVNEIGAAPSDLMAIIEAMKQAGALKAEIVVI